MKPLEALIGQLIDVQGPIDVATYMTFALGHPVYGYYRSGDPFGARGDFVTAPEISQVFGELVGLCLADYWLKLGCPARIALVECGPGRGTLMADLLRATRTVPGLHEALDLQLVEINSALTTRQAQAIRSVNSELAPAWHEAFDKVPASAPMFVIANEFLDALPIRQYVRDAQGLVERRIDKNDDGGLAFVVAGRSRLPDRPEFRELPAGTIVEVSPAREGFVDTLAARLNEVGGLALLIDYAHQAPADTALPAIATGDTLQGIYRGEKTSPLAHPGLADLTAQVDFAALRRTVRAAGARSWGPVGQGAFLRELGIELREQVLTKVTPDRASEVSAAIRRLIDPGEMGELFQVLALTPEGAPQPAGFDTPEPRG